jgi:flagellar biosynthesis anti-sigma factor FlgM
VAWLLLFQLDQKPETADKGAPMKVTEAYGAYDQISKVNPAMTINPVDNSVKVQENNKIEIPKDKVELSEMSKDLKTAKEAVNLAPEKPNEERIEELRRSVEEGSYQVHPEKIVDEMLRSGF